MIKDKKLMSPSKVNLIMASQQLIKAQRYMIDRLIDMQASLLANNKKVMQTESNNWYLKWRADYFENKLKEHEPNIDYSWSVGAQPYPNGEDDA
tara:strand:+ start:1044 stop:1325 length:282 start_codon:yes stop_codon:yes gene_type:complete